jgi:hypothetical protein
MAASIRKVTYPPDFNYNSPSEFRSNMKQLAAQMQILDLALEQTLNLSADQQQAPSSAQRMGQGLSQQQQVLAALQNIERIATKLQAGEAGSSHPFMQDYMRDFVSDVAKARTAVSLDQPLYYFAGRVSGGCVNCHRVNR